MNRIDQTNRHSDWELGGGGAKISRRGLCFMFNRNKELSSRWVHWNFRFTFQNCSENNFRTTWNPKSNGEKKRIINEGREKKEMQGLYNSQTIIKVIHKKKKSPGRETFFDSKVSFPIWQSRFVGCFFRAAVVCPNYELFTSYSAKCLKNWYS